MNSKPTANPQVEIGPALCPLCGRANDCQLCTTSAYKGPCWCAALQIPDELLNRVPSEARNRACICRDCVTEFHLRRASAPGQALRPEEFYFEGGTLVFTAEYHLRRGYCCRNGCRHCPFPSLR